MTSSSSIPVIDLSLTTSPMGCAGPLREFHNTITSISNHRILVKMITDCVDILTALFALPHKAKRWR